MSEDGPKVLYPYKVRIKKKIKWSRKMAMQPEITQEFSVSNLYAIYEKECLTCVLYGIFC